MPRRARSIQGGLVYHVLNRSNGRHPIFRKEADYVAFERVLEEAFEREPLRILAYCVLPNHWHFVVWPKQGADRQVSEFFRWLTVTHTQRWHAHYHTSGNGHLYQGRFKSFPVESDDHLYTGTGKGDGSRFLTPGNILSNVLPCHDAPARSKVDWYTMC
jgi:putative transposase